MYGPEAKSNLDPALARLHFPVWLLAALLALVTVALYWPALHCDFVNLDDDVFVTDNPHVQGGLTWTAVKWAFSNTQQADYWAPMMWLSHILACQLFGLNPWGHHLINVLLHALNTALVFLLFRRLTGAPWRSFFVAALFGWHPLRVESVAWVTERKDVLSAFFGLLSLLCYAKAVTSDRWQVAGSEKIVPTSFLSRVTCHLSPYYFWSLFLFALGLMSKAMLVTWPLVMLLLDWWPLERFKIQGSRFRVQGLVLEKLPFFGLAAAASVVTVVAQKHGGAVISMVTMSLSMRIGNALISYCRYLGKLFWPANLAVLYPHPGHWPLTSEALAGGALLIITVFCFMARRPYPFLLMGWLWFVGMLVPVIGLVQAGAVAMADRFTYLPSLGLLVLVIWSASELARRGRYQVNFLVVAGCGTIILCLGLTRHQLKYWTESEILFRHTLSITENNYLAHNNLGGTLGKKGRIEEAIRQFQETIRLNPDYAIAHYDLGTLLLGQGQFDDAIHQFQEAIRLKPDYAEAHNNLGMALEQKDRINEAIGQFQEAIRLKSDYVKARNNLGTVFLNHHRIAEAIDQYQEVIRLKPDLFDAHYNLGIALCLNGQIDAAIPQFQETIRLKPDYAEAHNNLGTVLGQKGQIDEAISQYQEAIRLKPDYTEARNNLAHALEAKNAPAGH